MAAIERFRPAPWGHAAEISHGAGKMLEKWDNSRYERKGNEMRDVYVPGYVQFRVMRSAHRFVRVKAGGWVYEDRRAEILTTCGEYESEEFGEFIKITSKGEFIFVVNRDGEYVVYHNLDNPRREFLLGEKLNNQVIALTGRVRRYARTGETLTFPQGADLIEEILSLTHKTFAPIDLDVEIVFAEHRVTFRKLQNRSEETARKE